MYGMLLIPHDECTHAARRIYRTASYRRVLLGRRNPPPMQSRYSISPRLSPFPPPPLFFTLVFPFSVLVPPAIFILSLAHDTPPLESASPSWRKPPSTITSTLFDTLPNYFRSKQKPEKPRQNKSLRMPPLPADSARHLEPTNTHTHYTQKIPHPEKKSAKTRRLPIHRRNVKSTKGHQIPASSDTPPSIAFSNTAPCTRTRNVKMIATEPYTPRSNRNTPGPKRNTPGPNRNTPRTNRNTSQTRNQRRRPSKAHGVPRSHAPIE